MYYRLEVLGRPPKFKPGQFIHVALDEYDPARHWPESRPFSIASAPKNRKELSIVVARAGAFTSRMFSELVAGREFWIKGPYGDFLIDCSSKTESVLIAGGTGISPFASFLQQTLISGDTLDRVQLHYSAKTLTSMSHSDLITRASEQLDGFTATCYLTAEDVEGFEHARPDIRAICGSLDDPQSAVFYLCGPTGMVEEFEKILMEDYRVQPDNIRYEEWS